MNKKTKSPPSSNRLGRGLSSLLGDTIMDTAAANSPAVTGGSAELDAHIQTRSTLSGVPAGHEIRQIPVEWITPGPWQPRRIFDKSALAELADSIKQRGLIQPVLLRPNPNKKSRFELIAGERRWRAAQLAQIHEIPAIIADYSDQSAAELSLIENIQREDLSVIEEADGYQMLIDRHNYTQEKLASFIGKSRSHIANLLRLKLLPPAVKNKLVTRQLTVGQVRPLIGHPHAEAIAERILRENLTARAVEALIKAEKQPHAPPLHKTGKSADIRALESRARTALGLSVSVDWNEQKQKGRFCVSVNSLEQFEDMLEKFGLC